MAALEDKIKKQVEFYFSDSNFPKDKFLRAQAALNEEGYVPLSVVASFSKMKALTSDIAAIVKALEDSEHLKVSSDGTMVKRVAPLPQEDVSAIKTVYAKGFPAEQGYTIDDVESVFGKFGKILCVRIRKGLGKRIKPSVFVEFNTAEEARAAAAATSTFNDKPLEVLMKADYFAKKKEERKQKFSEKKNIKRKADGQEGEEEEKTEEKKENKKQKTEEKGRTSGCIVRVTNIGPNSSRETFKEIFGKYGTVSFVDFRIGDSEAFLRFANVEDTKNATVKAVEEKIQVDGVVPEFHVLTEEEEKTYWDKVHATADKGKKKLKGGRRKRF